MANRTKVDVGIYQLAPRLFEVAVGAGPDVATTATGATKYRRRWKRVHGTLTDARKARTALRHSIDEGRHGGSDATVGDLFDAWLRELERLGKAPNTIRGYRKDVERYLRPTFGRMRVRDVTARAIADYLARLQEQGLAPNTVRLVHACLSSAFSQAAAWEWIKKGDDPTKVVRKPAIANRRPKIPSAEDVSTLLTAALESRIPEMKRAIWISATTGVRRGEVCALRISDLDLDHGLMVVERAISDRQVWTTKNRRERTVTLDPLTVAVITAQIDFMRHRAEQDGARLADDAYLFSDHPNGLQPWNPDRVTKYFKRLAARSNLAHVTFHQLRKFMESRALEAGFSTHEVASRAGHDPSVMLKFYAGGADERDRAIGAAVASLLAPGQ